MLKLYRHGTMLAPVKVAFGCGSGAESFLLLSTNQNSSK